MSNDFDYSKFDPEIAGQELEKIKNILKDLDENYEKITSSTDFVKEYWETKTSENVYNSMSELEKKIATIKDNFAGDVEFLENVVKQSYITRDQDSKEAADQQLHD